MIAALVATLSLTASLAVAPHDSSSVASPPPPVMTPYERETVDLKRREIAADSTLRERELAQRGEEADNQLWYWKIAAIGVAIGLYLTLRRIRASESTSKLEHFDRLYVTELQRWSDTQNTDGARIAAAIHLTRLASERDPLSRPLRHRSPMYSRAVAQMFVEGITEEDSTRLHATIEDQLVAVGGCAVQPMVARNREWLGYWIAEYEDKPNWWKEAVDDEGNLDTSKLPRTMVTLRDAMARTFGRARKENLSSYPRWRYFRIPITRWVRVRSRLGWRLWKLTSRSWLQPGDDLSGLAMTGAKLRSCDMRRASMAHSHLEHADIDWSDFRGSYLHHLRLTHAKIKRCDFRCADLSGANFEHAKIENCSFKRASMRNASLGGGSLRKADLRNADLSDVIASEGGVTLAGARLKGADLRNANLGPTVLFNADLRSTKLAGCDLQKCTAWETASWEGADLRSARLSDGQQIWHEEMREAFPRSFARWSGWDLIRLTWHCRIRKAQLGRIAKKLGRYQHAVENQLARMGWRELW